MCGSEDEDYDEDEGNLTRSECEDLYGESP
jgi:hypothetical protein